MMDSEPLFSDGDDSLSDHMNDGSNPDGEAWAAGWHDPWLSTAYDSLGANVDEDADSDVDGMEAPSADAIQSLLMSLGQGEVSAPGARTSTDKALETQPALAYHSELPTMQDSVESLDPELRDAFLDDASGCLALIEDATLQIETNPSHAASLAQICRQLHTLKGAAASVGLERMATELHALEDSLQASHAAGQPCAIGLLLSTIDSLRRQIGSDPSSQSTNHVPARNSSGLNETQKSGPGSKDALKTVADASPLEAGEATSEDESVRVKSSQLNRLMDMLAELVMLRNRRESELTNLQEIYHELIGSVSKLRTICHDGNDETSTSGSIRLSEVANDVLEIAQDVRECSTPVAEGNRAVSEFIRQFRKELVELRRTPASGLIRRLQRVVRDAARAESKQVQLVQIGGDEGIERSLQQRLYEPLLHIVRNCVCHGIESREQRLRDGKPESGTISVQAHSGPDLLSIEIRDDGRGLDFEAIRKKGIEANLISPNETVCPSELAQLILQPGFSTRSSANQIAGRGVGMDVVATTIKGMKGWLEIDSKPNEGTSIRLSLPIPSMIQHAMVFRSDGQLFALPMQSVQSTGTVATKVRQLNFSRVLNSSLKPKSSYEQILLSGRCASQSTSSGSTFERKTSENTLLLVDEIVGPEEVVVRPLPPMLKHHPYCTGVTLCGMGQTVLILDAGRLIEIAEVSSDDDCGSSDDARSSANRSIGKPVDLARPRVLVVDDSISARKRVVRSLRRYAVDITEATDGREALRILKSQRFDAIFSDMEMPHINGMELLSEIRAREGEACTPLVFISSRSEAEFTERAKQLGARDYLVKPLVDEKLDQALRSIPKFKEMRIMRSEPLSNQGENR